MGDLAGTHALWEMRRKMMMDLEGRKILEEKPRVRESYAELENL